MKKTTGSIERMAFEEWLKKTHHAHSVHRAEKGYYDETTRVAWRAWRHRAHEARVAEPKDTKGSLPDGLWIKRQIGGSFEIARPDGMLVARTLYDANGRGPHVLDAIELARLITASTNLLLALQEARAGLAWYQEMCPQHTDGSDEEAMERIDAAIEKATGVKP